MDVIARLAMMLMMLAFSVAAIYFLWKGEE